LLALLLVLGSLSARKVALLLVAWPVPANGRRRLLSDVPSCPVRPRPASPRACADRLPPLSFAETVSGSWSNQEARTDEGTFTRFVDLPNVDAIFGN
jgi:hypothetical protein